MLDFTMSLLGRLRRGLQTGPMRDLLVIGDPSFG